jgi:predicted transcriptional regulator
MGATFKVVTDTDLLDKKIEELKLTPNALAFIWGVSLPTYYKLRSGEREFTATQIVRSVIAMRLTEEERDLIFLTKRVSDNHE